MIVPRTRRTAAAALFLAVSAIVFGCGGTQVAADEVPGAPPPLTVPSDNDVGAGGSGNAGASDRADDNSADGSSDSSSGNADSDSSTSSGSSSDGGSQAQPDAAQPEATSAPTQAAPEATATPQQREQNSQDFAPGELEDFCANNPGAC